MDKPLHLLTIGHSHHSLNHFLNLLSMHEIQAVADVRSWPRSRYAPQFDAESLRAALDAHDINYLFLGRELGGRPEGPDLYDEDGHVLYDRVAATPAFRRGMEYLLAASRRMRVAVMCAEEKPEHCHRRLLIARVAISSGATVSHIRGDGRIEAESGFTIPSDGRLFDDLEEVPWRSTRSVSRRRARSTSSVV